MTSVAKWVIGIGAPLPRALAMAPVLLLLE